MKKKATKVKNTDKEIIKKYKIKIIKPKKKRLSHKNLLKFLQEQLGMGICKDNYIEEQNKLFEEAEKRKQDFISKNKDWWVQQRAELSKNNDGILRSERREVIDLNKKKLNETIISILSIAINRDFNDYIKISKIKEAIEKMGNICEELAVTDRFVNIEI